LPLLNGNCALALSITPYARFALPDQTPSSLLGAFAFSRTRQLLLSFRFGAALSDWYNNNDGNSRNSRAQDSLADLLELLVARCRLRRGAVVLGGRDRQGRDAQEGAKVHNDRERKLEERRQRQAHVHPTGVQAHQHGLLVTIVCQSVSQSVNEQINQQ